MLNLSKLLNRLSPTITLSEWGQVFFAAREMRDCNRDGAFVESLLYEADLCKSLASALHSIDQIWNSDEWKAWGNLINELCN